MTTWIFDPPTDQRHPSDLLHITLRFEGDVTVCALDGPLCAYTAPTLDAWLDQLRENGRHLVIVDAEHLSSISVDGIDVLAAHAERFADAGGRLRVRNATAGAERAVRLLHAAHLLEG